MNFQLHHFSKRLKKCEQVRRKSFIILSITMSFFCVSTTYFDHRHSSSPALLDLLQSLCTVSFSYQSDSRKLISASLLELCKSCAKS